MGLSSSSLQRAASEIIRFPATTNPDENSESGEHGAGLISDNRTTPSTTPDKAPIEGETPLEGSTGLKGSCGTLDQCETDGKDKSGSDDGSDGSTPKASRGHGGLSRSLADRIESPDFTPFGGSTAVNEKPALVPVPVETVTPGVPFGADFMMRETTQATGNDELSEGSRTSASETPAVRKARPICVRRKSNEERDHSASRMRHGTPCGVAPPAVAGRGSSRHSGSRNQEVSRTALGKWVRHGRS